MAPRNDGVIPWVTFETLSPGQISVVSVGEIARDFTAWQRVLQRQLSRTRALYDSLTTADIVAAIERARDCAEGDDLLVDTGTGPHILRVRPVFGPTGGVHAIRLWVGPAAAAVPVLRPAIGAIWDLETQTIQLPGGVTALTGAAVEEYVPRISIAELFHQVSVFDRHAEVLDLLYDPTSGDSLQFEATVTDGSRGARRWRFSVRARADENTRGAWLLIEDITSDRAVDQWPTLERVGLREAHRRAGTYLAVVQLDYTSISHWLTDPAPWVRWDYLYRPVDVFHADDRPRLLEIAERLRGGETLGVTVRVLNYAGGYTPTSLLLYPYPGYSRRHLAIAQLIRVGDNVPMLEPISDGLDRRKPRAPIGYDDQLRRRLATWAERSPAN
ncbi:GAF domain-containing protein [Nocardia sp. CDC160]|uniref:GAF domain-containing protein n=1 Tax=Nocardia sp. CDC160 TaxID=3112166 RepID=UPI002DB5FB8A|nr:GAF domain-containing protein [Nocardia sp. CDC160]MEC3920670.1 GAF domain-containing protein [Nocardia sp. CDC160]